MTITAQWDSSDRTMIRMTRGATTIFVPVDPENYDYLALIESGVEIGPYVSPPPPVPESVSDRQFFQALADAGLVSWDEALAAVKTGALPSRIVDVLAEMTEADRRRAEMLLSGATTFERRHPFTDALATALGYSSAQTDDLFRAAAAL